MYFISVVSVLFTIVCLCTYCIWNNDILYSFAVAFGTVAYHFLMRLSVGGIFNIFMKNKADYSNKWYQCSKWEQKLFKRLNVRRWKNRMPTFNPESFNPQKHSWDEIAQAMCQAELVHEVIIVLSFIPIIFSIWFGGLFVFIITSLFAALFDIIFVIMQRYNRSRIMRLLER